DRVDRAVRAWIAGEATVFGAGLDLETVAVQKVRNVWYARYRQRVRGTPVAFADWEFRINSRGGLMVFGADVHRVPADAPSQALLGAAVAREAARAGLPFDPSKDQLQGGDQLWWVPWTTDGETTYRLAYQTEVAIADPPARWMTLVDARSGDVLWRQNQVRYGVSGAVTGPVHPSLPTDPPPTPPLLHENVVAGRGT